MEEDNNLITLEEVQEFSKQYKKIMFMYKSALQEIETQVNIINDEFQTMYQYNPIEHIKTRIKSFESIMKKLNRKKLDCTYNNLVNNLNDIAGIRIVCSFIPDIYKMVEMFEGIDNIKILEKRDYIKEPKKSGYRSYHLIVLVPVTLSTNTMYTKVEIQLRTIAMDFWASLEHKIKYKHEGEISKSISKELVECSKMINKVDKKMSRIGKEDALKNTTALVPETTKKYNYDIISKIFRSASRLEKNTDNL